MTESRNPDLSDPQGKMRRELPKEQEVEEAARKATAEAEAALAQVEGGDDAAVNDAAQAALTKKHRRLHQEDEWPNSQTRCGSK